MKPFKIPASPEQVSRAHAHLVKQQAEGVYKHVKPKHEHELTVHHPESDEPLFSAKYNPLEKAITVTPHVGPPEGMSEADAQAAMRKDVETFLNA